MKGKKNSKFSIILIILILLISIGYALLSTVNKINSSVSLNKIDFSIHFDNIGEVDNPATVTEAAHIVENTNNKEIAFSASLSNLGDYYAFTTDIVNDGKIPGKIKSVDITGISDSQKKLVDYDVYYTNSEKNLKTGDRFIVNASKNVFFKIMYKLDDSITNDDLPDDTVSLNVVITIDYENCSQDEMKNRAILKMIEGVHFAPMSALDFTKHYDSNNFEGLYRYDGTENDEYPIYYYRGGQTNTNNHVKLGDFCWRIIRTTSTGGIKIMYNGLPKADGTCIKQPASMTDAVLPYHKYGDTQTYTGSDMAKYLDTWFLQNLIDYEDYFEDTEFCNNNTYQNGDISLDCNDEDKVSVNNGKIYFPIGLITAQEANLCGLSTTQNRSSIAWLVDSQSYWTMTGKSDNASYVWDVNQYYNGEIIQAILSTHSSYNVKPVVSLNSSVVFDTGDGTYNNPYTVSISE